MIKHLIKATELRSSHILAFCHYIHETYWLHLGSERMQCIFPSVPKSQPFCAHPSCPCSMGKIKLFSWLSIWCYQRERWWFCMATSLRHVEGKKRIRDSTYMTVAFLGPECNKGNFYLMTNTNNSMILWSLPQLWVCLPFPALQCCLRRTKSSQKMWGWRRECPARLGCAAAPKLSVLPSRGDDLLPITSESLRGLPPQIEGRPAWSSTWTHTKRRHLVEANGKWDQIEIRDTNRTQIEKMFLLIFHMENEPAFLRGHLKLIQVTHNTSCVPKHNLLISIIAPSCSAFSGRIHSGCFNLEPQKYLPRGEVWNFHGHYWKEKGGNSAPS